MKPKVDTRCIANGYSMVDERIVEFTYSDGSGGLISFRDEKHNLYIYAYDQGIDIKIGYPVNLEKPEFYAEHMNAQKQIDTEEEIASFIYDNFYSANEEEAAKAGRKILKMVLAEFRPDLFESEG